MSHHELSHLNWHKSTYSSQNGNCVEVAELPDGGRAVRDSKNPGGPMLRFTPDEWQAFVYSVKGGKFD